MSWFRKSKGDDHCDKLTCVGRWNYAYDSEYGPCNGCSSFKGHRPDKSVDTSVLDADVKKYGVFVKVRRHDLG